MRLIACADGRLIAGERSLRCALGKGGVKPAAEKREGDGASPIGAWPARRAFWRPDRLARPQTALPLQAITADDGWCDAPGDPAYNRPVRLPYPASAERMAREDGLYDIVVVLGHNDDPPIPGAGSAIFLHCAAPDFRPTEGCVAIERAELAALLARLDRDSVVEIRA